MLAVSEHKLKIVWDVLRKVPTEEQRSLFLKLIDEQLRTCGTRPTRTLDVVRVQLVNDCPRLRAISMPFLVLPEPAQVSARLRNPKPLSSLARTRAIEVFTVVSRLMTSIGCLLSAPQMLAVQGKSSRV